LNANSSILEVIRPAEARFAHLLSSASLPTANVAAEASLNRILQWPQHRFLACEPMAPHTIAIASSLGSEICKARHAGVLACTLIWCGGNLISTETLITSNVDVPRSCCKPCNADTCQFCSRFDRRPRVQRGRHDRGVHSRPRCRCYQRGWGEGSIGHTRQQQQ